MTTPPRLRIGIAGCGYQGDNLALTIAATKSMQLAACADIERAAAARLAAEHGNPPVFTSIEAMLAGSELDAVLVATPHDALHPVALTTVQAGKHLMVEKPVGINAQQVRELEEAVNRAGVFCLAGYSFRSFPALRMVKELVDGGVVGEIQAIMGSIGLGPLNSGWQATPETGGGPLLFVGSHLVDEVLWLLGDDPTEVMADVRTRADTGADETTAFQIAFAHGVTAQCTGDPGRLWLLQPPGDRRPRGAHRSTRGRLPELHDRGDQQESSRPTASRRCFAPHGPETPGWPCICRSWRKWPRLFGKADRLQSPWKRPGA